VVGMPRKVVGVKVEDGNEVIWFINCTRRILLHLVVRMFVINKYQPHLVKYAVIDAAKSSRPAQKLPV